MELLDSRQLRAFQELARQGSFTGAAKTLNLTQSAVSHSIKALEKNLEVDLFQRLGKTIRLTPSGEVLLKHADRILSQMSRAQDEIILLGRPGHGRLRIGATVTISQYVLPSVLRELRESFPDFDFSISTADSQELITQLETGEIDIAVALEHNHSERIIPERLFEDRIQMAISPIHPFATAKKMTIDAMRKESFIFYNQRSETFRQLEQQSRENGLNLRASLQVGSMAAIKEMAKIGMGVGLLSPWVAENELANGSLQLRPLPWKSEARHWAIHRDSRHDKHLIEDIFAGICKNVVDTLTQRTDRLLTAPLN